MATITWAINAIANVYRERQALTWRQAAGHDVLGRNAVEGFFSAITRRRIRRGVFRSVDELEDAIRRYIQNHNRQAKPFVWTKTAEQIRQKLNPIRVPSE